MDFASYTLDVYRMVLETMGGELLHLVRGGVIMAKLSSTWFGWFLEILETRPSIFGVWRSAISEGVETINSEVCLGDPSLLCATARLCVVQSPFRRGNHVECVAVTVDSPP